MPQPSSLCVGVDVQTRRACPYAILDEGGEPVAAGWLPGHDVAAAVASLDRALASRYRGPNARSPAG